MEFLLGYIFELTSLLFSNTQLFLDLNRKSLKEYLVNAGVPQGSILALTFFLLYIIDLPDDIIYNAAILIEDTLLYPEWEVASDLWQQNWLWPMRRCRLRWIVAYLLQCWKKAQLVLFVLFYHSNSTCFVLFEKSTFFVWLWSNWLWNGMVFIWEKNDLLRCLDLFLVNWIGALTLSLLLKAVSKKYGALICSVKFLSQVALDLYKSTIQLCMEYWCHVWAGALNFYLHISDK